MKKIKNQKVYTGRKWTGSEMKVGLFFTKKKTIFAPTKFEPFLKSLRILYPYVNGLDNSVTVCANRVTLVSRHGMFQSTKYLGHIHISEQRRILGHYLTKCSVYFSRSPHVYPICRRANKTYKKAVMSNRLK
jgi:hypothetical protein